MTMATGSEPTGSKGWIGYRPEIKVLDVTIRDGGLMNDHRFDDVVVRSVYQACVEGGIDYMEMGYKADRKIFAKDKSGCWKYCDEGDVRRVIGEKHPGVKLAVMADAERTDYHHDILPREQSYIDMVRIATYIHQIPTALDMIHDAHGKGYETTVNLMAASTVQDWELDEAIVALCQSPVNVVYLVDSFGFFYSEQVQAMMRKFLGFARPAGKEVGVHTHNNRQLAFANTIEAIIQGANYLDASFAGLGRGAGNCNMELLLGFLHNPKFRLRPVLRCIQDHIEPLREQLRWGYSVPYMITGQLNQHPRDAMKFMEGDSYQDLVAFFDQVVEEQ
jgi:4-hydroxy 2-oxovalerate aldolase